MSTTIDEKVVEMKFDNKDFESNVKTSMSTIDKLKEKLNFTGCAKGLEDLTKSAKDVDMSSITASTSTISSGFSSMEVIAISALNKITNQAIEAGEQLLKSLSVDNISAGWDKFTDKTQSVGTLISQGYDMDTVTEQLERLNWYTDETSYNFTDMVSNIAKFTASGQELEPSVTAMEGIANWAALSGQNATTASQAMYQLAQAMSAGSMRLQDWKSIQTANMDTAEFRQKCLDAGVALGTLKDNLDGTYESLVNNEGAFELSNFTEHLTQDAWLTSDVMMEVFNDYAGAVDQIYEYAEEKGITASEAIEEMGDSLDDFQLKAFAAAQEARSWGDVVDSVKDAVSTAWMNTFELIFGNYEEATELWTDLSEELYDVFAEPINVRNDMLAGAMTSSYDQIAESVKDCGVEVDTFQNELIETAKNYGIAVDDMIDEAGSFEDSIEGWLTGDIVSETLNRMADSVTGLSTSTEVSTESLEKYQDVVNQVINGAYGNGEARVKALTEAGWDYATVQDLVNQQIYNGSFSLSELSDAELESIGYTEEQIEALRKLADSAGDADSEIGALLDRINKPSGRDLLIGSFWDIWDSVIAIGDAIHEAWSNIFPATTSEQLYSMLESLNKFTTKVSDIFTGTNETTSKITRTFQGLFSILDLIREVVSDLVSAGFKALKKVLGETNLDVLGFTAKIGDAITAVRNWIIENDVINKAIRKLGDVVKKVIKSVRDFVSQIKEIPEVREGISKFCNAVKDGLKDLETVFPNTAAVIEALTETVHSLNDLTLDDVINVFKSFGTDAVNLIQSALKKISDLFPRTKETISDFVNNIKGINDISLDGIFNILSSLKDDVSDVFDFIGQKVSDFISLFMGDFQEVEAATDPISTVSKSLDTVDDSLSNVASSVSEISGPFETVASALTTLKNVISDALSVIQDKFSGFDWGSLIALGTCAALIYVFIKAMKSLSKMSTEIGTVLAPVSEVIGSFSSVLKTFSGTLKAFTQSIKVKTITSALESIVKVIIELAATIAIMSMLDQDKLQSATGCMSILIVLIGGLTVVLSKINGGAGELGGISKSLTSLIAVAGSVLLLVVALEKLETVDMDGIVPRLAVLGTLVAGLVAVAIAINKFAGGLGGSTGSCLTLIGFAAALYLVVKSLEKVKGIDLDGIVKPLLTLVTIMGTLGLVSKAVSGSGIGSAVTIIAAVIALKMIIGTMTDLASVDADAVLSNMDGIAVAFGSLAALLLSTNLAGKNAAGAGVAILAMSASLLLITEAMKQIAKMNSFDVKASMETIEEILAMFGLLMVGSIAAGKNAAKAGVMILAISAALLVLTGCLALLSLIDDGNGNLDGPVQAITEIMGMFAVIVAASGLAKSCTTTLAVITVAIIALSAVLAALTFVDQGNLESATQALLTITGIIGLLLVALDLVGTVDTSSLIALGVLSAITAVLGIVIGGLCQIDGIENALEVSESISLILTALVASTAILSKVKAGGVLEGIAALGEAIGGIAAILVIAGGIKQIPGIDWLISEGSEFLDTIGTALGSFVGSIVGGLLEGVTNSLPQIGDNLSSFMTNADKFFTGISSLDPSSVESVGMLTDMILKLTEANMLDAITSFITGGKDLEKFGTELSAFIDPFSECLESLSETTADPEKVETILGAGSTLLDFANEIPNSGGVIGFFAGNNDIGDFGISLNDFTEPFVACLESLSEATADPEKVETILSAGSTLLDFANEIPNSGGAISYIVGDNDIGDFGTSLKDFTEPFVACLESLSSANSSVSPESVSTVLTAGDRLLEFADKIPNSGGVKDLLFGSNDLGKFGTNLKDFTEPFVECLESLSSADVNVANVNIISHFAANLSDLLKIDASQMGTFSSSIDKLGTSIENFCTTAGSVDKESLSGLSDTISSMIESLETAMTDRLPDFVDFGKSFILALIEGIDDQKESLTESFITALSEAIAAIDDTKSDFNLAGQQIMSEFISGIQSKSSGVKAACTSNLTESVKGIKGYYSDFYNAGVYLMTGFIDGIGSKQSAVNKKVTAIANDANKKLANALGENSPSKITYQFGEYYAQGLVNGLEDSVSMVCSASSDLAESANTGMSEALISVSKLLDEDLDMAPTIRPVIDMSDVQSGVSSINSLFSRGYGFSVDPSMANFVSASMRNIQNDDTSERLLSAIKGLNRNLAEQRGDTYNVNGITYDDGSNVSSAVSQLIRAANIGRRR